MRLRGLVFERFVTFERAEVNLCDESGAPLDVVLFVGESGAGKTALLRGIAGILTEAASGEEELRARDDIRRESTDARCRVVFDDVVDGGRVVVTLEKELPRPKSGAGVRASPPEAFERWRRALEEEAAPRAAFSVEAPGDDDPAEEEEEGGDPLFEWLASLQRAGGRPWDDAVRAIDRVLWPSRFDHIHPEGDLVFSTPSGLSTSSELGDAFESVLVMALELLRLSTARPSEELVYVIDDIDAHLHPHWQSRLLGDLRRAFPRVQLVATTHSPFVVASVEPNQVFRLVRAEAKTSIVRISDRIQRSGPVSNVMDLAFGSPDLPGPRWLHNPALNIRRDLMRAIADDLTRGAVVYALPEPVHVKEVRDAFNELAIPSADGAVGYLFFIDLEPGAAWGHSCEYVFRTRDGKLTRQKAIWPPAGLDRFVPIGRG